MNDREPADRLLDLAMAWMTPNQRREFARLVTPGLRRIILEAKREPTNAEHRIFQLALEPLEPRSWWKRLFR